MTVTWNLPVAEIFRQLMRKSLSSERGPRLPFSELAGLVFDSDMIREPTAPRED